MKKDGDLIAFNRSFLQGLNLTFDLDVMVHSCNPEPYIGSGCGGSHL